MFLRFDGDDGFYDTEGHQSYWLLRSGSDYQLALVLPHSTVRLAGLRSSASDRATAVRELEGMLRERLGYRWVQE